MSAVAPSAGSDWYACRGQLLPKVDFPKLFQVIGNTFGGHSSTFALPDLQGRTPIGIGSGDGLTPRELGDVGGEDMVVLNSTTMASHTHAWMVSLLAGSSDEGSNSYVQKDNIVPPILLQRLTCLNCLFNGT